SHTDAGQESLRSNGAGFALSQSWSETGLLERQTLVNGGAASLTIWNGAIVTTCWTVWWE
ncbi:hypothetical protein, partial [Lonsdalea britannica]|uniref:hypothetical protein n=1 Tax=Lonsdalea britannica TaxID=1082704 RepID=UPI00350E4651